MKLGQILIPVAIGAGIIITIMAMIEVNNILVPILAPYNMYLARMNQLNALNIAVLAFFIGIAEVAWFGVVVSKDEPTNEDETIATYEKTLTLKAGGWDILDDLDRLVTRIKRRTTKKGN